MIMHGEKYNCEKIETINPLTCTLSRTYRCLHPDAGTADTLQVQPQWRPDQVYWCYIRQNLPVLSLVYTESTEYTRSVYIQRVYQCRHVESNEENTVGDLE